VTLESAVPADWMDRVQKLVDDRVSAAIAGILRNARITGGQGLTVGGGGTFTVAGGRFRVQYPDNLGGGEAVYSGDIYSGGVYVGTGFLVQAPDGTDMILARQDLGGGHRVELYDSGNRIIVGNDATSGQGLARPYLDSAPRLTRYVDWPTFTLATIDVWETVHSWSHVKQHPRLEACVYASMDTAATAGEMRIMVDGIQLGSTAALAFAQGPNFFGPANVAGAHMAVLDVQVQIRRTTATGAVRLTPAYCRGKQSP
jgi:hypothetical protein